MRRGRIAAGQRCFAQMRHARESCAHAAGENFTAPNRAVVAVAGAVEADADHALVPRAALREYGSNMRAVMLRCTLLCCWKLRSMQSRSVLRMGVMHNQQLARIDLIHRKQVPNCLPERAERFVMIQISNVLADERLTVNHEGDRVLEVCTQSKNGPIGWNRCSRARRIPARPSQNRRAKCAHTSYRIIHPARDGPRANQK